MLVRLNLELPEDEHYVSFARHTTRYMLKQLNVAEADVDVVETIVGELCNNVVLHASENTYKVELEYHRDRTVVSVTDEGAGFNTGEIPAPGTLRVDKDGSPRIGGFGLLMVQSLADRVDFTRIDPKGMRVQAEIQTRLNNPGADSAVTTA